MPSLAARALALTSRLIVRRVLDAPRFDLAAVRRVMNARLLLPALLPRGLQVTPSREPHLPGEWLLPADVAPRRTILYVHGGGFVAGSLPAFRPLAGWMAVQARARVLSLDYRLAPEHPFPAALDDVVAAVRALAALGTDPRALGIAGDSAGGCLALGALLALREAGDPLPGAAALISPVTDLASTGESLRTNARTEQVLSARHQDEFFRRYAGDLPREHPLLSPHYADLRGLPSLLIHASDTEILFDDARRLVERARSSGVAVELEIWRDMPHDFHAAVPYSPEARMAVRGIGLYFARRTG